MMYANMDVSVVCRNINCWHYILMASLLARSTLVLEEKTPQTSRWQQSVFISQNRKAEDGQAVVMVNHFHTILTDISTSTGEYVWLNVSTWSFGSGRRNKEARGEKWRRALKGFKLWTLHSHAPICSAELPMRMIFFKLAPVQQALSAKKKPTGANGTRDTMKNQDARWRASLQCFGL